MIEALSTMLDAAIGRDGRAQIPLAEELQYVDAYLYITKERLGDRLTLRREIDEAMLPVRIPRLMLQPIVENAVEHDLSRRGGELCLRAVPQKDGRLLFEIEHDGEMTPDGWARIQDALQSPAGPAGPQRGSVGVRNVAQRLRLLYGEQCSFTITAPQPGKILARIVLPQAADAATTDNERQQQARKRNDTPYPDAENAVK